MPFGHICDKFTLFQVIAWCRQARSPYLNQRWPRSLSPYDVTRPLWGEFSSDKMLACNIQYIPRNMQTIFALLCFVVVIHWLIFPYPSGLLHWHCGNLTIAPVPAKQPWWIWINSSCEFIMNDCITTTKQSTTKPCAYFLGYTVITQTCLPLPLKFGHKWVITSHKKNMVVITYPRHNICWIAMVDDAIWRHWSGSTLCQSLLSDVDLSSKVFRCIHLRAVLHSFQGNFTGNPQYIYRQVSNIRHTQSQHLKDFRTVLRLSLSNPLKPDVKSRMKM